MTESPSKQKSSSPAAVAKPSSTSKKQAKAAPSSSSRRVVLGQATVWRELGVPFGILLFAILFCWGISDIGTHVVLHKKTKMDLVEQMITERAQHEYETRGGKLAPHCRLFLAKSTLPGAGWGVFVGRDYAEGETMAWPGALDLSQFLPTSLLPEKEEALQVHPFAFMIQHHHRMANIDGTVLRQGSSATPTTMELKVTKPIPAGNELFLPFASHPKSRLGSNSPLFEETPSQEELTIVEDIIQDMMTRFRYRKGRDTKATQIEETLALIQKTVRRLNPKIAAFLPTKKAQMDRWIKEWKDGVSFYELALPSKSVQGLEMNAKCLSYTMQHPQQSTTSTTTILAQQKLSKGAVVLPIPLLLLPTDQTCPANTAEEDECQPSPSSSSSTACWQSKLLPFAVCPLTLPQWLVPDDKSSSSKGQPNVEYQWGSINPHNDKSRALTADQVQKQYTTQLSMDLVALRDIEPGEPLRVKEGMETLIPQEWK